MVDILTPKAGEGKELCDLLRAALGIPPLVKSFEVRFAQDEPVSVKCEFIATAQPEESDDDAPTPSNHRGLDG